MRPVALNLVEIHYLFSFDFKYLISIIDMDGSYLCLMCLQSTRDRQREGLLNGLELLVQHFDSFKAASLWKQVSYCFQSMTPLCYHCFSFLAPSDCIKFLFPKKSSSTSHILHHYSTASKCSLDAQISFEAVLLTLLFVALESVYMHLLVSIEQPVLLKFHWFLVFVLPN